MAKTSVSKDKTAKLFMSGSSQALRLPKEFRFDVDVIYVRRDKSTGDVILSTRPGSRWRRFMELRAKLGGAPQDFGSDRKQGEALRDPFEGWKDRPDAEDTSAGANPYVAARSLNLHHRRDRIEANDMITPPEAAQLIGTSSAMVKSWIDVGRCIGVPSPGGAFKLPRWQFDPAIWSVVPLLAKVLGTTDGWQLLTFFESPSPALGSEAPRVALERGVPVERILALAAAWAH